MGTADINGHTDEDEKKVKDKRRTRDENDVYTGTAFRAPDMTVLG